MKTWLSFLLLLSLCFCNKVIAQEQNITTEDIIRYYPTATPEEKLVIDSLFSEIVEQQKAVQINSICGVSFGSSREEVGRILRNKFGEPHFISDDSRIVYENIKYAGIDFDSLYFLFQSDGYNSFLSTCIFLKDAKNKSKAIEITELYKNILSKKYTLSEDTDFNGFKTYGGGISPLWKGDWYDFLTNLSNGKYLTAIHTDVIEFDESYVKKYGNKYSVRIIYGPFQYVTEEF